MTILRTRKHLSFSLPCSLSTIEPLDVSAPIVVPVSAGAATVTDLVFAAVGGPDDDEEAQQQQQHRATGENPEGEESSQPLDPPAVIAVSNHSASTSWGLSAATGATSDPPSPRAEADVTGGRDEGEKAGEQT